ncbi:MAG: D-glycero-beta-D-manno-heptose 1-phosphate adenylyltransferase, partial [Bacteroidota bacterium]
GSLPGGGGCGVTGRVTGLRKLKSLRAALRKRGRTVVFTNGTFDILHRGHVEYLERARRLGDVLIVGLNTDASIRRIKGKGRPVNGGKDRAVVLAALRSVDYVCFFGEDTPARLIGELQPDVLVKGADWKPRRIVGREAVEAAGGKVRRIPLTPGRSTSRLIARILKTCGGR